MELHWIIIFSLLHLVHLSKSHKEDKDSKSTLGDGLQYTNVSDEIRLYEFMNRRYTPLGTLARPVLNSSQAVVVFLRLSLMKILDVDETNGVFKAMMWKQMNWVDEYLKWDPSDYGGITRATLPEQTIWTPDLVLYNDVGGKGKSGFRTQLGVEYTGLITWIPLVVYQSSCDIHMTAFPFDTQTCHFKFGSWSHNVHLVDLQFYANESRFFMGYYNYQGEWDIKRNNATRNVVKYACCPFGFVDLTFNLTIRRKPAFHVQMTVFPIVLLGAMTGGIFWIPAHRPDRIGLAMSTFSAFIVLLLVIVNSAPPSSTTKLGILICAELTAVGCAILVSVFAVAMSHRQQPLPSCIKWLPVGCIFPKAPNPMDVEQGSTLDVSSRSQNSKTCQESHTAPEVSLPPKQQWDAVVRLCDRLCFVLYIIFSLLCIVFLFPRP